MDEEKVGAPTASPLEGRYCNYFRVGHNPFEFLIEFGQSYVEQDDEAMHTRVVTTPAYAREFAELLCNSVAEYETRYGPIRSREE